MSENADYLHGTEPDEQRRLSTLNDLINEASLQEARIHPGERILDVGSGLGQLTRLMAKAAGPVVVGIERSAEQLGEARRQAAAADQERLVEFRQGDATALALRDDEWGKFDVA